MEDKCEKKPNVCEKWPFSVYQATEDELPQHQVGQLVLSNGVFRPRLIRVVVNSESTGGRGGRGNVEHVHDVYHLVAPRWGCAVIKVNGAVSELVPGEALVISPGEPHCFMTNAKPCVFTALTFEFIDANGDGQALTTDFHELARALCGEAYAGRGNRLDLSESLSNEIHQTAGDMVALADEEPVRACMLLQRLLLDMALGQNFALAGPPADGRLALVYTEIRRRFREPLDMDRFVWIASMSRRSLTRRFKERYGVTVKRLQVQLRMDAALLMLKTTNMQVQEIAHEIGYSDVYQFTTAFSKRFGMAPSVYREEG